MEHLLFEPQPHFLREIFTPIFLHPNPSSNSNWTAILEILNGSSYLDPNVNSNATVVFPQGNAKSKAMRFFVGIIEFLVFSIGTPANCLVLALTYEIFRQRARNQMGDGGGKQFQNGQLFVVIMTIFDLFFCLIHSPIMFLMLLFLDHMSLHYSACIILYVVTHTTTTGSSLSLLALNVEKFIRLYKPLHHRSIVTRTRTVVACVLIWLISLSWGIFLVFGPFMVNKQTPKSQCWQSLQHPGVYVYFAAQFFVLPTLVSLAISGFTLLAALKTRKHRAPGTVVLKRSLDLGLHHHHHHHKGSPENGHAKSKKPKSHDPLHNADSKLHVRPKTPEKGKTKNKCVSLMAFVGFVFTTTIWSSATILPYRIVYLWTVTHPNSFLNDVVYQWPLFALLILNAAGNPFITIITKRQYSNRVRKLLFGKRELANSGNWRISSARHTDTSQGDGKENGTKAKDKIIVCRVKN